MKEDSLNLSINTCQYLELSKNFLNDKLLIDKYINDINNIE